MPADANTQETPVATNKAAQSFAPFTVKAAYTVRVLVTSRSDSENGAPMNCKERTSNRYVPILEEVVRVVGCESGPRRT